MKNEKLKAAIKKFERQYNVETAHLGEANKDGSRVVKIITNFPFAETSAVSGHISFKAEDGITATMKIIGSGNILLDRIEYNFNKEKVEWIAGGERVTTRDEDKNNNDYIYFLVGSNVIDAYAINGVDGVINHSTTVTPSTYTEKVKADNAKEMANKVVGFNEWAEITEDEYKEIMIRGS